MLLFARGRSDALQRFLVDDGIGKDARFWKLAQSLSALYYPGTEEAHTNPTRQRGACLRALAGASG